jgi:hypothetical protein
MADTVFRYKIYLSGKDNRKSETSVLLKENQIFP